jgi:hypothetical protein
MNKVAWDSGPEHEDNLSGICQERRFLPTAESATFII